MYCKNSANNYLFEGMHLLEDKNENVCIGLNNYLF